MSSQRQRISISFRNIIRRAKRRSLKLIDRAASLSPRVKILGGTIAVFVTAVTTLLAWNADRSFLSIPRVNFVPTVPEADKRVRLEFILKNSGKVPATIQGMATDRFDEDAQLQRYGYARIDHPEIPAKRGPRRSAGEPQIWKTTRHAGRSFANGHRPAGMTRTRR